MEWITTGVACNCRNDGRQREDFRPLSVKLGELAQATGSARVQLGETDVIVGVKVRRQGPMGAPQQQAGALRAAGGDRRRTWNDGCVAAFRDCLQAEIGSPDLDRPDCGRLNFAVECSPVASPAFRVRRC